MLEIFILKISHPQNILSITLFFSSPIKSIIELTQQAIKQSKGDGKNCISVAETKQTKKIDKHRRQATNSNSYIAFALANGLT